MGRIFSQKIHIVPGAPRPFYHLRDAEGWCADHGVDTRLIDSFDSKAEHRRWVTLKAMEDAGEITDLHRQVEYEIIPAYRETRNTGVRRTNTYEVNGHSFTRKCDAVQWCRDNGAHTRDITKREELVPVLKEFTVEKAAYYTADFVYTDRNGITHVEDVKSEYTRREKDYILRRKLMLFRHDIQLEEILP